MACVCGPKNVGARIFGKEGKGDVTGQTFFFFQLKCRIPDLIPRENAEALSSLHFQTPADILVSALIPVMPLLSGDATGVYLNIQLESS